MCLGAPFYQTEALPWPNRVGRASAEDQITYRVRNGPWDFMEGGQSKIDKLRKETEKEKARA